MTSSENIHICNIIKRKQVVFLNIYISEYIFWIHTHTHLNPYRLPLKFYSACSLSLPASCWALWSLSSPMHHPTTISGSVCIYDHGQMLLEFWEKIVGSWLCSWTNRWTELLGALAPSTAILWPRASGAYPQRAPQRFKARLKPELWWQEAWPLLPEVMTLCRQKHHLEPVSSVS